MRPAVPAGTLHTERVGRSHSMAGSAATRSTAGLVPRHTLVHCYAQDHMQGHSWTEATGRPTSLLVRVQLPHISSAADAELDVKAESLSLAAQEYSLRLTLPYCVNDEEGSAKFDATSHTMEISLPVVAAGTKRKQLLPPPQQQQQYAVPRARGVAGKMVKRRDMDDTVLHRDFKFLEGAERQVDAGRRQRRQWPTNRPAARGGGHHHHHHHHYPDRIPKKISIVRDQARRRGTELVILAAGMRKRQQNSSYYNIKGKILSWRVEWVFKVEDGTRAMITDERLDESTSPRDAIERHIGGTATQRPGTAHQRLKLRQYVAQFRQAPSDLRFFLKREIGTAGQPRYDLLDSSVALRDSLRHRTLVEYPIIYVALPSDSEEYCTDQTGAESSSESSSGSSSESDSSDGEGLPAAGDGADQTNGQADDAAGVDDPDNLPENWLF